MSKRILIVGAGANQVRIIEKAREIGLGTVAVDGDPHAPGLGVAEAGVAANILDGDAVLAVAKEHAVDGVYPAAEAGVEATAHVATALGLPGVTPDTARCMRNKVAMHEAFERAGAPNTPFRTADLLEEAEAGAAEIGFPLIVKPAAGNASKGVRQVDYAEDMVLAFQQAQRHSADGSVLLEAFMAGDEYNVDGLVHEGEYRLGGMTGKDRSPPPFRFDRGIHMPPALDAAIVDQIVHTVDAGLRAVGFDTGTTHVEVILTQAGPRIIEMAGRPGGGRIPTDLIPLSYGMDYAADSLRVALGEPPNGSRRHERGSALYWLTAKPGVVTEIRGVEDARALPGVEDLVIGVHPGEVLGHIVDCVSRDRIGYVMTSGDTADAAIETAHNARALCEIVTNPAVL